MYFKNDFFLGVVANGCGFVSICYKTTIGVVFAKVIKHLMEWHQNLLEANNLFQTFM